MVLSDIEIIERVEREGMIEPFFDHLISDGVVSYGLSSYGYDFRVANEFKVFSNVSYTAVDPKRFDQRAFVDIESDDYCIVPPNSFALARTVEYFRVPRDVITICLGKSTYARCGLVLNVTPFEPGWEGHATLEISNTTPLPARVYANEGIGQVLFLRGSRECRTSYKDRRGKYDQQIGIVLPRIS
jgi:dCTP deaminase